MKPVDTLEAYLVIQERKNKEQQSLKESIQVEEKNEEGREYVSGL